MLRVIAHVLKSFYMEMGLEFMIWNSLYSSATYEIFEGNAVLIHGIYSGTYSSYYFFFFLKFIY